MPTKTQAPASQDTAANAIVEAVATTATANGSVPSEYTTLSGVVLKLKRVPQLAVRDAGRLVPDPKPPVFFNQDQDRNEENPLDPAYIEAVSEATTTRALTISRVYLALGTALLSVPTGMNGPADAEWVETLEYLGLAVPLGRVPRYVTWLEKYVLEAIELNTIVENISRLSGIILAADVAVVESEFKSDETRPADRDTTDTAES